MNSEITKPSPPLESSTFDKKLPRLHFRPDIEGLRGVAILLIIGYHAKFQLFQGGYIGVDIFFVLSGYLITWLLINEAEENGTINLLKFYARRVRRLLPAVAVMVIVIIPIGAILLAPFEHREIANTAVATSAYLSNFYFARAAVDYLGSSIDLNPLLHTWSLGVEEQFYMVWPLFVIFSLGVSRWQKRKFSLLNLFIWMGIVAIVSFLFSVYLTSKNQPLAFFLLPTRAWEFAIGALGLLIPAGNSTFNTNQKTDNDKNKIIKFSLMILNPKILGYLGLFGILISASIFNQETVFPGFVVLIPALSTVLVLRAGAFSEGTGVSKILGYPLLNFFGKLSYSWYLWHWPIFVFASVVIDTSSIGLRISLIIISFIVAKLSFHLIENPIRFNRWLIQRPSLSLGFALILTIIGISISFTWRQMSIRWADSPTQLAYTNARNDLAVIYENGCHLSFFNTEININDCETGEINATRTVILYGDSHAAQWYPALEIIAFQEEWRLIPMTKSSCPFLDLPVSNERLGREYTECDTWRLNVVENIQDIQPFIIVMTSINSYPFSTQEWFTETENTLRTISPMAEIVVILGDTPYTGFDVPTYLARKSWIPGIVDYPPLEVRRIKHTIQINETLNEAAGKFENVFFIDMYQYICPETPCLLEISGQPKFRDNHHLSKAFSESLAPILTEQLENAIRYDSKIIH
ncbi:acyltransferase family protein [Chloroflexota bacterium]